MGISAALEIGRNGLNIYQKANEVTSENIANVNTPGYSRQRVILESAPPTTANGFPMGTGVRIAAVERYYDGLLQQQVVNAQTTLGYDTTKSNVLQQIEPAFNEVANDGLGAAVSEFFGAWQDLTLNPAGYFERQAVITRAQVLADNFKFVSTTLNNTISTQNATLTPLTDSINATLSSIANLNSQIKTTELVSGNANETRDQRDQLVRELAQQVGITYQENSDGITDVNFTDASGTYALVSGATAGAFSIDTTNPNSYAVQLTPAGASPPAVTVTPTTGKLGAILALRDSIIPAYLTQVDTLAKSIVDEVNALHTAGFSPTGGTGQDFFAPLAAVAGSAANFSLAGGLTSDKIAASGGATLPGDNAVARTIAQLSSKNTIPSGTPSATFNDYYSSLVSKVGLDVQSGKSTVAQGEAFGKQLSALRDSYSGVSLDEELTNLIKYQRSYQASAKLISTATDMLDTAIGLVR